MEIFYITFPRAIPAGLGVAIKVEGENRLDALIRLGATVWTEREWAEVRAATADWEVERAGDKE